MTMNTPSFARRVSGWVFVAAFALASGAARANGSDLASGAADGLNGAAGGLIAALVTCAALYLRVFEPMVEKTFRRLRDEEDAKGKELRDKEEEDRKRREADIKSEFESIQKTTADLLRSVQRVLQIEQRMQSVEEGSEQKKADIASLREALKDFKTYHERWVLTTLGTPERGLLRDIAELSDSKAMQRILDLEAFRVDFTAWRETIDGEVIGQFQKVLAHVEASQAAILKIADRIGHGNGREDGPR